MRTGATLMTQETPMTDSSGNRAPNLWIFPAFFFVTETGNLPRENLRLNLEIWIKRSIVKWETIVIRKAPFYITLIVSTRNTLW